MKTDFYFLNDLAETMFSYVFLVNSNGDVEFFSDNLIKLRNIEYNGNAVDKLFPKIFNEKMMFLLKKSYLNNKGIVISGDNDFVLEWLFMPFSLEGKEKKVLIIGFYNDNDNVKKDFIREIDELKKNIAVLHKEIEKFDNLLLFLYKIFGSDFDEMTKLIIEYLPKIFEAKYISFSYLQNNGTLRVIDSNFDLKDVVVDNINKNGNILFSAIKNRKPLLVEDIQQAGYTVLPTVRHTTKKCIIIPLINSISEVHKELGVISLSDKLPTIGFSRHDLLMAKFISLYIGERLYIEKISGTDDMDLPMKEAITGLNNHRIFNETLVHRITQFRSNKSVFSLAFVDVDNLDDLNEQYGYKIGDKILKEIAQILVDYIDNDGAVFYYSGGKYAVIMNFNSSECIEKMNIVKEAIETEIVNIFKLDMIVTVSVGICEARDYISKKGMIFNANYGLSRAKALGKNQIVVFTPEK